jgi:hypothetical protein
MSDLKEISIYDVIIKKKEVTKKVDTKLIMKAYNLASEKHKDQKRSSGEPYIIHPLCVAYILAEMGLDDKTICSALLHDIIEDTDVKQNDLKELFGGKLSGDNQTKTVTIDEINAKIGTVVNGYSAKDLEWQIYYADETETFLISKTLAKENNVIPTNLENTINIKDLSYGSKWNSKWLEKRERESVTNYYENARATSFLCDPTNWTEYKVNPATYAVGGPTLELLIASWNVSQNSNVQITDNYINALKGYVSMRPDEFWNQHLLTADINNGVYCDRNGLYFLASPSCNGDYFDGSFLRSVNFEGMVGECIIGTSYYDGYGGCRPIVSIPTSKISINGDSVTVLP